MKTRKLLNKTLLYYVGFCILYLLLTIPLFYYASNRFYEHELNEYLTERQEKTDGIDIPKITHEAQEIIVAATWLQMLFFIGLMLGFVLITQLVMKRLWTPFYQTLNLIEQFNIRKNELPPFPETTIREFSQLNKALEKLVSNNLQAYKTQKEFTENASHEMQTPLAVFQSKLDILLQQPNLSEEQLFIIQSLYDVTSRLVRMNKNLLLLAKMDNLQFLDTEALNVPQIISESLSFLSEQAEAHSIHIEMDIAAEQHLVQANKILLESLINNLIANAIKHNIPNGAITISFQDSKLTIKNTGVTKALDKTVLFRRFVRMNERTKGSGLGLAIVQQICGLYQWQIAYWYEDEMHQFTVKF
ncbi:MAG: HAMP domain-containing histidine kinase [Candidatus Symbiothrix sp.]|nr:HAMP domain-containing histidine kinase [Candidatus Symbiothrix sp.]